MSNETIFLVVTTAVFVLWSPVVRLLTSGWVTWLCNQYVHYVQWTTGEEIEDVPTGAALFAVFGSLLLSGVFSLIVCAVYKAATQ